MLETCWYGVRDTSHERIWMPEPIKQLESYELTARPMRMEDVPALHPLSIGVQWPHRPEDWAMLIRLGQGVVAEDEIGRVVGSAMWWPMGPDLARICMVITTPRLQEQGAARWLMHQIAGPIGARDKVLTATRAALRLYLSLGFRPGLTVHQHQGIVAETPTVVPGARPMMAADEAAVRALDAAAPSGGRCSTSCWRSRKARCWSGAEKSWALPSAGASGGAMWSGRWWPRARRMHWRWSLRTWRPTSGGS